MVQFNFFQREVNCKIVYYGPGLSGKTTNLEMVHKKTPSSNRGELTSIATEQDRTLFFDFMPIDLGTVAGMKTKLRLFTVPGQVFYNSTRKLVLQGADGVIFVADSQRDKLHENLESLKNLEENLRIHKLEITQMPLVIQWNKRDMPTAMSLEELEQKINYLNVPTFEGIAVSGKGVFPTLKRCAALVLESVTKQASMTSQGGFKPGSTGSSAPTVGKASTGISAPALGGRSTGLSGSSLGKVPAGVSAPTPGKRPTGLPGLAMRKSSPRMPTLTSGKGSFIRPSTQQSNVPKISKPPERGIQPLQKQMPVRPTPMMSQPAQPSAARVSSSLGSLSSSRDKSFSPSKPPLFKKFKKFLNDKERNKR